MQYPRYKHVVTKQLDLSENELKELGIGLGDAPCELAVYWQKEHPDKLRLSPPLPASRPIYFALLSLGLFVFQVIPLRLLRPHPKEKWQ